MEIDSYLPIGCLGMVVVTVGYRWDYRVENAGNTESAETVLVPLHDAERFFSDAQLWSGLEEYEKPSQDDEITFFEYVSDYEDQCPYIINAFYVDEMGKLSVLDVEAYSQLPSAMSWKK